MPALLGAAILALAGCQARNDNSAQTEEIRQDLASLRADVKALQEQVAALKQTAEPKPAAEPAAGPAAGTATPETPTPATVATEEKPKEPAPADPKPADEPAGPQKAVWDGFHFIVTEKGEGRPLKIGLPDFKPGLEVQEEGKTYVLPQKLVIAVRLGGDGTYVDPVSGKRITASRADVVRGSFQHPQLPGLTVRVQGYSQKVSAPLTLARSLTADFKMGADITMVHTGGEWWSSQPCPGANEARAACSQVTANPPGQVRELMRLGYQFSVSRDGYIYFALP